MITGPDGAFEFDHLAADKYQMYGEAVGYPLQGFDEHEPGCLRASSLAPTIPPTISPSACNAAVPSPAT